MNRAVIYCRISKDEEKNLESIEKQISEATAIVQEMNWILTDSYVDFGKTGTTTKNRKRYNKLYQDLETEKFDIIVVKSQDRLMRSTKDWYLFVDRLVKNQKRLYFYIEKRFYSPDDALLTGIRAIMAEEYSRELSKKQQLAHEQRQSKNGRPLFTSQTWGYDKKNGNVIVNEPEAEMVRMIFQYCIEGYGARSICKILSNNGYVSRSGKPFLSSVIKNIIRNPLYKGTQITNKVHYDFSSKQTINMEPSTWRTIENAVPPIIDEEVWALANQQLDKAADAHHADVCRERLKGKPRHRYPFSSKIQCGLCGSTYWMQRQRNTKKEIVLFWCCREYLQNGRLTKGHCDSPSHMKIQTDGGCDNIIIKHHDILEVLRQISNSIRFPAEAIQEKAESILSEVIISDHEETVAALKKEITEINLQRNKLLDAFLDSMIEKETYQERDNILSAKKIELSNRISELSDSASTTQSDLQRRIAEIKKELQSIVTDDLAVEFLCQHIERIIVYPEQLCIKSDFLPDILVRIEQINYRKRNYIVPEM